MLNVGLIESEPKPAEVELPRAFRAAPKQMLAFGWLPEPPHGLKRSTSVYV
jgi:hypothetical protein